MKCKVCGNEFKQKSNSHIVCIDCKKRICKKCGKVYYLGNIKRNSPYCSQKCYLSSRWGGVKCKNCGKDIKPSTRYCSPKCRKEYWNKNEYQLLKKKRFWKQKNELLVVLGGKCIRCGISDIRVLDINHKDRSKKTKANKSQYTWQYRLKDWKANIGNLEILCANCHRIHTWEQMNYNSDKVIKKTR